MSVVIGFAGVAVFFRAPFSPTSKQFQTVTNEARRTATHATETFGEEVIARLPLPVQRYFRYCGYLGAPRMSYMKASLENVDFVMSEIRTIKIDYEQFNLAERPERYALISSSLFGIPFEGLDSYGNGGAA